MMVVFCGLCVRGFFCDGREVREGCWGRGGEVMYFKLIEGGREFLIWLGESGDSLTDRLDE